MSLETQKFLQAEEAAAQLTDTLAKLREEAVSFKTSTSELDLVRKRLVSLIEGIEATAKDTQQSVKVIKSIGGPEILRGLRQLRLFMIISLIMAVAAAAGVLWLFGR